MFDLMNIIKALADESRVRILMALRGRELCVCQITGLLDMAPSSTSRHLSILRQARLVDSRKRGRWVYYSLPKKPDASKAQSSIAAAAVQWLEDSLVHEAIIEADAKRIEQSLVSEKQCYELDACGSESFHSPEIHTLEENLLEGEDMSSIFQKEEGIL